MSNKRVRSVASTTSANAFDAKRCQMEHLPDSPIAKTAGELSSKARPVVSPSYSEFSKSARPICRSTRNTLCSKLDQIPFIPPPPPQVEVSQFQCYVAERARIDALEIQVHVHEAELVELNMHIFNASAQETNTDESVISKNEEQTEQHSSSSPDNLLSHVPASDANLAMLESKRQDLSNEITQTKDQILAINDLHNHFPQASDNNTVVETFLQQYLQEHLTELCQHHNSAHLILEYQLRAQKFRKMALMKEVQTSDVVLELCVV